MKKKYRLRLYPIACLQTRQVNEKSLLLGKAALATEGTGLFPLLHGNLQFFHLGPDAWQSDLFRRLPFPRKDLARVHDAQGIQRVLDDPHGVQRVCVHIESDEGLLGKTYAVLSADGPTQGDSAAE